MDANLIYKITVFFHVLGALGLIATFAIEAGSRAVLRRAVESDEARLGLGLTRILPPLGGTSAAVILASGLFMMATRWGPAPWILVALASLVVTAALGAGLTGRAMARLGQTIGMGTGPLGDEVRGQIQNPVLTISLSTRVAIVLGVVFLMTLKPPLLTSLAVIGLAAIIGLAAGWASATARGRGHASEVA